MGTPSTLAWAIRGVTSPSSIFIVVELAGAVGAQESIDYATGDGHVQVAHDGFVAVALVRQRVATAISLALLAIPNPFFCRSVWL